MSDLSARQIKYSSTASFIDGMYGSLFCISSEPSAPTLEKPHIIVVAAPFAEELNRSRRFLTLLRRSVSGSGLIVVQPDLYGTGDSAGVFSNATVEMWCKDLLAVAEHFTPKKKYSISFLGLRSGCLLIDKLIRENSENWLLENTNSVIYIQPEISGYDVIQRMLRSRVAVKRFAGDRSETTEKLWERLKSGQSVSSSGYVIGADLALGIRPLTIDHQASPPVMKAKWFSLVENDDIHCIHNLWNAQQFSARPFWQLQDNEPESYMIKNIQKYISDTVDEK